MEMLTGSIRAQVPNNVSVMTYAASARSACTLSLLLWLGACSSSTPAPDSLGDEPSAAASVAGERGATARAGALSQTPSGKAERQSLPAVTLAPPGRTPVNVSVEVVRTPRKIQLGLMYRNHMPPDHGMLFLMGEERVHSFWMRNTLIPLDMIFIGRDMRVVGVVANAEPLTDTSRSVGKPSYYVLEVNGGWAEAHGVGPGTAVQFHSIKE